MGASIVMAIIALVVAIVAMCIAMNQKVSNDSSADSSQPSSEEGRKVTIVRGTAWVKSTQITVWTDTYTTGG